MYACDDASQGLEVNIKKAFTFLGTLINLTYFSVDVNDFLPILNAFFFLSYQQEAR